MSGLWTLIFGAAALIAVVYSVPVDSSEQNAIEATVIIDVYLFNSWKDRLAARTKEVDLESKTKVAITNYVQSVFSELNSVFKELSSSGTNLDARVMSIEFVMEEDDIATDSPRGSGLLDSGILINEFWRWLHLKKLPKADHYMLLTGLDLTSHGKSSNAGKATVAGMCHGYNSISVVEAKPSGSVVFTIAHELAHSLSAQHDGDRNDCGTYNIMSPVHRIGMVGTSFFRFSNCTANYFKTYLNYLGKVGSCLSAENTTTPPVSAPAFGERYAPDEICKMAVGKDSYFARTFYGDHEILSYNNLCSVVLCKRPEGGSTTVQGSNGFVCGKGKKCYLGECVESPEAPTSVSDTCPLGDSPVSSFGQKPCSQAVSENGGRCYSKKFWRECCASCATVFTNRTGCEYGDKGKSCKSRSFPMSCYRNENYCCGTCGKLKDTTNKDCPYGDKMPWCANHIASNIKNCRAHGDVCCKSCQNYIPSAVEPEVTPAPKCRDKVRKCGLILAIGKHLCYKKYFQSRCCATCATFANTV